jgi:hypothetical protein
VCGVDLKGSAALLAIVSTTSDGAIHIPCATKRIALSDDKDAEAVRAFLQTIRTFHHENAIDVFAIKSRAHGGKMGGGAVSFKLETLFQLIECETAFVNPVALAKFGRGNLGGIPASILRYQEDAYRCAAFHLNKVGEL